MQTQHPEFPVNVLQQKRHTIYQFMMTAQELATHARVERFGESADGVNRKIDERHAMRIAEAMLDPDTVMLDAICGDLKGSWRIEKGMLIGNNSSFLSIDDGQHRWHAISELSVPEERERWSFTVVATMGLDYATRLKIFRQQRLRKQIDS